MPKKIITHLNQSIPTSVWCVKISMFLRETLPIWPKAEFLDHLNRDPVQCTGNHGRRIFKACTPYQAALLLYIVLLRES